MWVQFKKHLKNILGNIAKYAFVQFVPVCRNAGSLIGNVAEYKIDIGSVNRAVAVDVQLGQQSGFDLRIFREGVIVIAGTVICTIQHYHVNICGVHPTIAVCIACDLREIFVRGMVVVVEVVVEVVVLVVVEVVVVEVVVLVVVEVVVFEVVVLVTVEVAVVEAVVLVVVEVVVVEAVVLVVVEVVAVEAVVLVMESCRC